MLSVGLLLMLTSPLEGSKNTKAVERIKGLIQSKLINGINGQMASGSPFNCDKTSQENAARRRRAGGLLVVGKHAAHHRRCRAQWVLANFALLLGDLGKKRVAGFLGDVLVNIDTGGRKAQQLASGIDFAA